MDTPHSAVMVETCRKATADITLIVHSDDENLTRVIHQICRAAIGRALGPMDDEVVLEPLAPAPMPGSLKRGMSGLV